MSGLACVTGRFQPVHRQHLELFEIALQEADRLIVAVTNPDSGGRHQEPTSAHRHLPESPPFPYFGGAGVLAAALGRRGLAARSTVGPFRPTPPRLLGGVRAP